MDGMDRKSQRSGVVKKGGNGLAEGGLLFA
jgi:hypothetical protein